MVYWEPMAPTDSGSKIVRSWTSPTAPTGEGTYYELEDGTVWKTTLSTPTITGVRYGDLRDGRIKPR